MSVTAAFTASSLEGYPPLAIQFTDQSTGSVVSWLWDFGDNQTSTEQNPQHVYTDPGYFEVKLTVSSGIDSDTIKKLDFIKVNVVKSEQKIFYITVYPTLKTYDFGPPESRQDLQIMVARGIGQYLFFKDNRGVRSYIQPRELNPLGSGFKRLEGPTLIFD